MKWIPDTHEIEFDIKDDGISFVSSFEEYQGINPGDLYNQIVSEHIAINQERHNVEILQQELLVDLDINHVI